MTEPVPQLFHEIRARLDRCQSVAEVDAVAKQHGKTVHEWSESPTRYTLAIIVKNHAEYMRRQVRRR